MNIEFEAQEAGIDIDEYSITAGVSNKDNALLLSRETEEQYKKEDWGPYLEFNDQINGEYGCIEKCTLNNTFLELSLSKQLDNLQGVTGFKVTLNLNPESFNELVESLNKIFRGHESVLEIHA